MCVPESPDLKKKRERKKEQKKVSSQTWDNSGTGPDNKKLAPVLFILLESNKEKKTLTEVQKQLGAKRPSSLC